MKSKSETFCLKLVIAYDGGAYFGWQRQPNGMSVQQRIEEVLEKLCGQHVNVYGASRTDTGVHALGMVAHIEWSKISLAIPELHRALNALLPEDLRVLAIARAAQSFHARFDAVSKLYRYRILNSPIGDPFRRGASWFIPQKLNVTAMREAAAFFVGKHNFSSVAVNPGYERTTMVRHIHRCAVIKKSDEVHVEIEGDGFLYKMVRTIVGTLVEVGYKRRTSESVRELLKSRDRRLAGQTAPAHGLFLVRVRYR